MNDLILICNPFNAYSGKLEDDVAREYFNLAIVQFDRLVGFDKAYDAFKEIPDHVEIVGEKKGRKLSLTLFAEQPIVRVGNIHARLASSSYLFNTLSEKGNPLPDLDVVHLFGRQDVLPSAMKIKSLYENAGWLTYLDELGSRELEMIQMSSSRFKNPRTILYPQYLLDLAEKKAGYVQEKTSKLP